VRSALATMLLVVALAGCGVWAQCDDGYSFVLTGNAPTACPMCPFVDTWDVGGWEGVRVREVPLK
jgi:hypothetical protein